MIALGVANLQKAIKFYEEGFGFPRMEMPPEVAFFTLNGTWLGLISKSLLAKDAMVPEDGKGFHHFALIHNVASEAEVDEVIEKAQKIGAVVTRKAQKADWGGYSGYIKDLDDHLWEIAYNPHFWVGPND